MENTKGGAYLMWPFKPKTEIRESGGIPFSDAIVAAIVQSAGGTSPADPTAIAALEAATGLYSAAFAGAAVTPANALTAAVSPAVRALIARDLIRRGESLHLIRVRAGQAQLLPAGSWDVRGPWRKRTTGFIGWTCSARRATQPGLFPPGRWFTPVTRWTRPARGWAYHR